MLRVLPGFLLAVLCLSPAFAVTGNAPPAAGWAARAIVMIVDRRDMRDRIAGLITMFMNQPAPVPTQT